MADLSIRNLDDEAKRKLRIRAAQHGRSMEAEARAILEEAVLEPSTGNLLTALHAALSGLGGLEVDLQGRPPGRFGS